MELRVEIVQSGILELNRFAYGWYLKEILNIKFNHNTNKQKLNIAGTPYSEDEFNNKVAQVLNTSEKYNPKKEVPEIYKSIVNFAKSEEVIPEEYTLNRLYQAFSDNQENTISILSFKEFRNSPHTIYDILFKYGRNYLDLKEGYSKRKVFTLEQLESYQLKLLLKISENPELEAHEIVVLLRKLAILTGLLIASENSIANQEAFAKVKANINSSRRNLTRKQRNEVRLHEKEIEKYLKEKPKKLSFRKHLIRYWYGYAGLLLILLVSIITVNIYSEPEPPEASIKIPSKLQKEVDYGYLVVEEFFDYYNSSPDDRLYFDIYDPNIARLWFDKGKKEADDSSKWFHFGQALSFRYDFIDAYIERGKVKVKLGFFKNAISDFNHALRFVYHPYILIHRAKAKEELTDYKGAILDCDTAIRIDPTDAENYIYRGSLKLQNAGYSQYDIRDSEYEKLQEKYFLTSAIADFDTAITIEPNNYIAYRFRGGLKHDLRKFDEAIADFRYALALNPIKEEKAQLYHMLAWAIVDKVGIVVDDYTGGTYSKEEHQALVASYAFADSSLNYADEKHPGFFRYEQLRTFLYFKLNPEKNE